MDSCAPLGPRYESSLPTPPVPGRMVYYIEIITQFCIDNRAVYTSSLWRGVNISPHYLNNRYLNRHTNLSGLKPCLCDWQACNPGCVASIDHRTIDQCFWMWINDTPLMESAEQWLILSLEPGASIAQRKMTVSDPHVGSVKPPWKIHRKPWSPVCPPLLVIIQKSAIVQKMTQIWNSENVRKRIAYDESLEIGEKGENLRDGAVDAIGVPWFCVLSFASGTAQQIFHKR